MNTKLKWLAAVAIMAAGGFYAYGLLTAARVPADLRDAVADNSALGQLKGDGQGREYGIPAASVQKDPGMDIPQVSPPSHEKGFFSSGNSAVPAPQPLKEWTVMVYMNGKNSLEMFTLYNLNKMELVGSDGSLNILTETGRMNGQPGDVTADGNWTGSRRYYVTRDGDEKKVNSQVVRKFSSVDMGDWKQLVDFAKWGKKNYPARHYALIVWNHGSGWWTTKGDENKGISYDDETHNHISTPELGAAMREIGKVDILAYDACLMQMAELLYEVRGYADYVVASEETIPGEGFPYDVMLPAFKSSAGGGDIAMAMVRAYEEFYRREGGKATLSAVRMSALGDFMAAFNAWTDALLAFDKKLPLRIKAYQARSYTYRDNKDIYDFADRAAKADPRLAEKGRAMLDILEGKLIMNNTAWREFAADPYSHGLAIYAPNRYYNTKYDQLAWSRDTRWDEFVKGMLDVAPPKCPEFTGNETEQEMNAILECADNLIAFNGLQLQ